MGYVCSCVSSMNKNNSKNKSMSNTTNRSKPSYLDVSDVLDGRKRRQLRIRHLSVRPVSFRLGSLNLLRGGAFAGAVRACVPKQKFSNTKFATGSDHMETGEQQQSRKKNFTDLPIKSKRRMYEPVLAQPSIFRSGNTCTTEADKPNRRGVFARARKPLPAEGITTPSRPPNIPLPYSSLLSLSPTFHRSVGFPGDCETSLSSRGGDSALPSLLLCLRTLALVLSLGRVLGAPLSGGLGPTASLCGGSFLLEFLDALLETEKRRRKKEASVKTTKSDKC